MPFSIALSIGMTTKKVREKVRENRIRRMAERQGYRLVKSRRRDHRALEYGNYWLHNERHVGVLGGRRGVSLDDIEEYLTRATVLSV
jgi:hypothetical protein